MHLTTLKLSNFKNFQEKKFQFSDKINAFVGRNGVGKTNALDAVYYLALTKSYLNFKDSENINFNSDFFLIEGQFHSVDREDIVQIQLKQGLKKVVKKNTKPYAKISEHIGQFPAVMISPYDSNLITEGSDKRRKFLDSIIGQANKQYLQQLIEYNKVLSQRNALLKHFALEGRFNADALEIYDFKLTQLGTKIYAERNAFISEFQPQFQLYYQALSNQKEEVSVVYESQLSESSMDTLLQDALQKDRFAQHTTIGIHKDDLIFKIHQNPIKKFGSQGQQKSFLIALKLAKLALIKTHLKTTPILLLDDIFDKLDEQRVEALIKLVNEDHFGQIFISDTHPERTQTMIQKINAESAIFELE